nr:MAG TPA: hypothetical protein [Caudoviricetes sp.]
MGSCEYPATRKIGGSQPHEIPLAPRKDLAGVSALVENR